MGVGEHSGSALWPKFWWNENVPIGGVQTSNVLMGTITGARRSGILGGITRNGELSSCGKFCQAAWQQFIPQVRMFMLLLHSTTMHPLLSVIFRTRVLTFADVKFYTLRSYSRRLGSVRSACVLTGPQTWVQCGRYHLNARPRVLGSTRTSLLVNWSKI